MKKVVDVQDAVITETPESAVAIYQPKAKALTQISTLDAGRAALMAKYKDIVYDCTKTAEMEAAKAARMEIREARYKVPHIIKAFKASQKEDLATVEGGGDTLITEFFELENPIHAQIEAEEKRKAAEKLEKERLKAERLTAIRTRIAGFNQFVVGTFDGVPVQRFDSDRLTEHIMKIEGGHLTSADYAELLPEAEAAKADVLTTLKAQLVTLVEKEANDKRLEAERVETERKASLQLRLDTIRRVPIDAASVQCWDELEAQIKHLGATDLTDMAEYEGAATEAITKGIADIRAMIDTKKAAKKLADDQAAFALVQDEQRKKDLAEQENRDRRSAIRANIDTIKALPLQCVGQTSMVVTVILADSGLDMACAEEDYSEFTAEADVARLIALEQINTILEAVEASEKAAATLKSEQDALLAAQKVKDDAAALALAESNRKAKEKADAATEAANKKALKKAQDEYNTKMEAATADHLTTLNSILSATIDDTLAAPAALQLIGHLVKLAIEKEVAA